MPRKTLGHFVLGAARAKFGGQVEWHLPTARVAVSLRSPGSCESVSRSDAHLKLTMTSPDPQSDKQKVKKAITASQALD